MKALSFGTFGLAGGVVLVVMLGVGIGLSSWRNSRGKVLTNTLAEPLNGAKSAQVEINAGAGNLTIDRIAGGEALLASGALQYRENQPMPAYSRTGNNGQAVFKVSMGDQGRNGFHFPWEACNGEFEWLIHLNPAVATDLTTHSGGGNLKLDLMGMVITRLLTDTGGGNIDLTLPEGMTSVDLSAKTGAGNVSVAVGDGITGSSTLTATSGAGNVTVTLPKGIGVKVHASSDVSKILLDPGLTKVDNKTAQSPDFNTAANKIEVTVSSGAGNVSVTTR